MNNYILYINFIISIISTILFAYCGIKSKTDKAIIFMLCFLNAIVFLSDIARLVPSLVAFRTWYLQKMSFEFHAIWLIIAFLYFKKIKKNILNFIT